MTDCISSLLNNCSHLNDFFLLSIILKDIFSIITNAYFSGEPDLQGQRLKYLSVKRGKGKSEKVHVLLKDILIVDPEDPVHRKNMHW